MGAELQGVEVLSLLQPIAKKNEIRKYLDFILFIDNLLSLLRDIELYILFFELYRALFAPDVR